MVGVPGQQPELSQRRVAIRLIALLAAFVFASHCAATDEPRSSHAEPHGSPVSVRDGRPAMGTVFEVQLEAPDPAAGRRLVDETFAEIERLEALLSRWRPDSEISQLNRTAGNGPRPVSSETAEILRDAQRYAVATEAFDVSVGPLVALWQRAAERNEAPSAHELRVAAAAVGVDRAVVELAEPQTVSLAPGMRLDLGGLLKGWALDRAAARLRAAGVEHALLNLGGSSLVAIGEAPEGGPWRVLVGSGERQAGVLAFADQAVSVSAARGQTIEIAGRRYGHVIDPASGMPVDGARLAVVLGRRAADTEAWSTALLVLGAAGIPRAHAAALEAMLVEEGALTVSDDFPDFEWLAPPSAP